MADDSRVTVAGPVELAQAFQLDCQDKSRNVQQPFYAPILASSMIRGTTLPLTWRTGLLTVLKNDKRAIITAAAKAQAVAEYLTTLQRATGREAA